MADLPVFYIDNVTVTSADTIVVRGNVVTDITAPTAIGIQVSSVTNLRAKDNKVLRVRSPLGQAIAYDISNVTDVVMVYNIASRSNVGFKFTTVTYLDVYNMTAHLCDRCVSSNSSGTFRNAALSAYPGYDQYRKSTGFYAPGADLDIDYTLHYGLAALVESANATVQGSHVYEKQILYIDEPSDDFTPDYISEQVVAGTANPLGVTVPDISGVDGPVTVEATANRNYWYDLLDNSFWDIENQYSAEVSFIKALQSRGLASTEVLTTQARNDMYVKTSTSMARFSELYPTYARYATTSEFQKRVADLWYASQNPGTMQAYQNGIGGYNLLPSFFKRMEDYEDGWVLAQSCVDYDNWINSMADLKYGIGVDVLGLSTLNQATSEECYANVTNTISDVGPVRWFLHSEVEPAGYLVFSDMYNGFENCALTNMIYNDDFNISTLTAGASGEIQTPLISTLSVTATGVGDVELSLLDRTWSEGITRTVSYRLGNSSGSMGSWVDLTAVIGEVIPVDKSYIQFRIKVEDITRTIDYEFMGLALRAYTSERDWTRPTTD